MTGQCLCGAVTFSAAKLGRDVEACHCTACRRSSGGGPFLGVAASGDAVRFHGVEHIGIYRSSDWAERGFCTICGSNLFFRMAGEAATGNLSLCHGLFDAADGFGLTTEMFIDQKPDCYALAGDRQRITAAEARQMLRAFLAARTEQKDAKP